MVMTLGNYVAPESLFTFPYNPLSFDDPLVTNHEVTNIPFARHHFFAGAGGIAPKQIVLTGHLSGASKLTNYRALAKHVNEDYKLKKLYWESDKFYLCVGGNIKQTNSGGRTNFIDYVATFETVIGILLSNTQKTHVGGGSHETNVGGATTFIEQISGIVTNGAVDITIADSLGNSYTIPNGSFATGNSIVITFVKMVDSGNGIYITEYNYCTAVGSRIRTLQVTGGSGLIQLAASGTTADLTITNLNAGYTVIFREGYIA